MCTQPKDISFFSLQIEEKMMILFYFFLTLFQTIFTPRSLNKEYNHPSGGEVEVEKQR